MNYNPLYDKGFTRVGCIGCPLAGKEQLKEFALYPKYKQLYINSFQRMVDKRKELNKAPNSIYSRLWKDGESVYRWWIEDRQIDGQLEFDINGEIKEHSV